MIIINGVEYNGRNVVVNGGTVYIDGKIANGEDTSKTVNITIHSSLDSLKVDSCYELTVFGNVKDINTVSGDVTVKQNVTGSISSTSGDILVDGHVGGSCSTVSGDIKYNR